MANSLLQLHLATANEAHRRRSAGKRPRSWPSSSGPARASPSTPSPSPSCARSRPSAPPPPARRG